MADVKLFDSDVFSSLKRDAELSPRRRANYNVHEHYDDVVQRLFIAMMPDSYVRPHRHTQAHKWEFFMVLEGSIDILFFDDDGCLTKRVTLQAGGECCGLQIPPLTWHATVCDAPVIFMEVKQGPYDANEDKGFADWAPQEGRREVTQFLGKLKHAKIGTSFFPITG